jgi:hypothetical protein
LNLYGQLFLECSVNLLIPRGLEIAFFGPLRALSISEI